MAEECTSIRAQALLSGDVEVTYAPCEEDSSTIIEMEPDNSYQSMKSPEVDEATATVPQQEQNNVDLKSSESDDRNACHPFEYETTLAGYASLFQCANQVQVDGTVVSSASSVDKAETVPSITASPLTPPSKAAPLVSGDVSAIDEVLSNQYVGDSEEIRSFESAAKQTQSADIEAPPIVKPDVGPIKHIPWLGRRPKGCFVVSIVTGFMVFAACVFGFWYLGYTYSASNR